MFIKTIYGFLEKIVKKPCYGVTLSPGRISAFIGGAGHVVPPHLFAGDLAHAQITGRRAEEERDFFLFSRQPR